MSKEARVGLYHESVIEFRRVVRLCDALNLPRIQSVVVFFFNKYVCILCYFIRRSSRIQDQTQREQANKIREENLRREEEERRQRQKLEEEDSQEEKEQEEKEQEEKEQEEKAQEKIDGQDKSDNENATKEETIGKKVRKQNNDHYRRPFCMSSYSCVCYLVL